MLLLFAALSMVCQSIVEYVALAPGGPAAKTVVKWARLEYSSTATSTVDINFVRDQSRLRLAIICISQQQPCDSSSRSRCNHHKAGLLLMTLTLVTFTHLFTSFIHLFYIYIYTSHHITSHFHRRLQTNLYQSLARGMTWTCQLAVVRACRSPGRLSATTCTRTLRRTQKAALGPGVVQVSTSTTECADQRSNQSYFLFFAFSPIASSGSLYMFKHVALCGWM